MDETDIQRVEQTPSEENQQMELIAKIAAQILANHYPNYAWMVGWMPGMALAIKLMGADARWGFTIDVAKAATVSELEHAVIFGGGELLERLNLPRKGWDGEDYFGRKYEGQTK